MHCALALVFNEENTSNYLRWLLSVDQNQLTVSKTGNLVLLETFDLKLFDQLVTSLQSTKLDEKYISKIQFSKEYLPERPAQVQMSLKGAEVELFKFYRSDYSQLVMDFWINSAAKDSQQEVTNINNTSVQPPSDLPAKAKVEEKKSTVDQLKFVQSGVENDKNTESLSSTDFRYGSTFIWKYPPLLPIKPQDIALETKTPDFYVPVPEPEVHSKGDAFKKLMLNFYKKKKYGKLASTKAIYLSQEKVSDEDKGFIAYLEANILLESAIDSNEASKSTLLTSGIRTLEEAAKLSKNDDIKIIAKRFLIQYYLNKNDFRNSLIESKNFFVQVSEMKQAQLMYQAVKSKLYSLSLLGETDKIEELLKEPTVELWLDSQEGLSYKFYTLYQNQQYQKLLAQFEKLEKGLTHPIESSLIYHVAESYFQVGEIQQSKKYYDYYLKNYTQTTYSSYAYVRLGLCSELLGDAPEKSISLYLEAINKSTMPQARYEAKVRLVGVGHNRATNITSSATSLLGFLTPASDEDVYIKEDLKKLLWQSRLRSFLKTGKYKEAWSYYTTLPLDNLHPDQRETFERDGTEIVLGLMQAAFQEGNDAQVLKLWGLHSLEFGGKMQFRKPALYYASASSMKLGLKENSLKLLNQFKENGEDGYPLWVHRTSLEWDMKGIEIKQLISSEKWNEAEAMLATMDENNGSSIWAKTNLLMQKENYKDAQAFIEQVLTSTKKMKLLSHGDLSEIIDKYLTVLEKNENGVRYQKRLLALIPALSPKIQSLSSNRERTIFLLLESYFQDSKVTWDKIDNAWNDFKESYPSSLYLPRINYSKANYLLRNSKTAEAKKILNELVGDTKTPEPIKKMSQSDLINL
jgi:tetratricopeptide (TPR) repeat protein